jgi:hypothetical protein
MSADERPRPAGEKDAVPRRDPASRAAGDPRPTTGAAVSRPAAEPRVVDAVVHVRDQDTPVADKASWLRPDDRPHFLVARGRTPNTVPPYRPHIAERPLRRVDAFRLPRPRARVATVIVTGKSRLTLVGPNTRPPRGEILRSGGTLYEVDLGLHHTTLELELPAKGDSCDFHLTAHVEWRVDQPVTVVCDHLSDIRDALAIALRMRLGETTREYDIADMAAAEAAVRNALLPSDVGSAYGLKTKIVTTLAADEKSRAYSAARRELKRAKRLEDLRHRNAQRQDDHERKRQRERMAEYRRIVASGNVEQFALHLARRPEDVADVVKLARDERYEERKQFTDLVTRLVQSGAISRWEVDDQVRLVLEWLAESTERVMRTDVIPKQRSAPPTTGSASTNGVPGNATGTATATDETTNGHVAAG